MASVINRHAQRLLLRIKTLLRPVIGGLAVGSLRVLRLTNRKRTADLAGAFMRRVGPLLPEHRVGRANLVAAFPEKSPQEIERILAGVWDNLGRVAAEFSHLDRLTFQDAQEDQAEIVAEEIMVARFLAARDSSPTLFFAAHLANWEIPALTAARFDLPTHVLFRPPNVPAVRDAILKIRSRSMGTLVPSSFSAPLTLARAVENGHNAAMLVDQHDSTGTDVTFFGRTCKANTLLGQLARRFDCPIRGVRVIRLPDGNTFQCEMTEPLDLPRDAEGKVDIKRTTQAITSVIEGWVREHPEQWLWLHRRWR
jgi:KDO2-lipid IV(A) lauroyltransferase